MLYRNISREPRLFERIFRLTVEQFEREVYEPCRQLLQVLVAARQRGPPHRLCPNSLLLLIIAFLHDLFPNNWMELGAKFGIGGCRAHALDQRRQVPPEEFQDAGHAFVAFTVDATEQHISRPWNNQAQRLYYSGKSKRHTVKSQVVITAETKEIVSVTSGHPGSHHDKRIWDEYRFFLHIADFESILADSGYQGIQHDCSSILPIKKPRNGQLTEANQAWNRRVGRRRVKIENTFGEMKGCFRILNRKWKNRLSWYAATFEMCCALYNIRLRATF